MTRLTALPIDRERLRGRGWGFGPGGTMAQGVTNFIDPSAVLGQRTKVWHFAVVLQECVIGDDVSIGSLAEIGRGTVIGNRTRIGHGVFLPPNSVIGEDVFIGPCVVFTDDKYPRANNADYDAQPPLIEDGASVGAGAVILPGVRIGAGAMVGAGAIVTRDVPPRGNVRGEPAHLRPIRGRPDLGLVTVK